MNDSTMSSWEFYLPYLNNRKRRHDQQNRRLEQYYKPGKPNRSVEHSTPIEHTFLSSTHEILYRIKHIP